MAYVQAANTSSLVWRNGAAHTDQDDGYIALLRALVTFAAGKAFLSNVGRTGTGNGTIGDLDGGVGAPTETWTITFSSATAFAVSGSVSGAQAGGTVGTAYTTTGNPLTSLFSFLITAGGTAFINGDTFTVDATVTAIAAANRWILDRWDPSGDFNDLDEAMIWHGPGDGTQAIYAGIRTIETPGSSIWNWQLRTYTGFSGSVDWENQPGVNGMANTNVAFWDQDMVYWIVANARRYIVLAKVSTTYHACYQGFFLPYTSPAEYPYPIINLGENDDTSGVAWNTATTVLSHGIIHTESTAGELRDVAGAWLQLANAATAGKCWNWPAGFSTFGNPQLTWTNHQNMGATGGDHQLMPIMFGKGGATNTPLGIDVFGVLDGAFIVTGFGNSVETVLTISAVNYLVVQNVFRNQSEDFWALELA